MNVSQIVKSWPVILYLKGYFGKKNKGESHKILVAERDFRELIFSKNTKSKL